MVNRQEFQQLVDNTTKYLQQLMNRVNELEAEVEDLKSSKPSNTRAQKKPESV